MSPLGGGSALYRHLSNMMQHDSQSKNDRHPSKRKTPAAKESEPGLTQVSASPCKSWPETKAISTRGIRPGQSWAAADPRSLRHDRGAVCSQAAGKTGSLACRWRRPLEACCQPLEPPTDDACETGRREAFFVSKFGNILVFLSLFAQRGLILVFERPLCGFSGSQALLDPGFELSIIDTLCCPNRVWPLRGDFGLETRLGCALNQ